MTSDRRARITNLLHPHEGIGAAWVFGSVASGTAGPTSDLDVAVLPNEPLAADEKLALIETLAQATSCPVDLIDLQATHGPIVDRILQTGTCLFCVDTTLYAGLLKRWWLDRADWRPYRRRILQERRQQWIGN